MLVILFPLRDGDFQHWVAQGLDLRRGSSSRVIKTAEVRPGYWMCAVKRGRGQTPGCSWWEFNKTSCAALFIKVQAGDKPPT